MPSFLTLYQPSSLTNPNSYKINSNSLSDEGTYNLVLQYSFSDYPSQYTSYIDQTVTWKV
jgi:hypothetical protein